MIAKDTVFPVGEVQKTHGIHGELNIRFNVNVDSLGATFLLFDMDTILVPFFIKSMRSKSGSAALVLFDEIKSESEARDFVSKTVFLPNEYKSEIEQEDVELQYFNGFKLIDAKAGEVGVIIDIDDSTENVLFVVESGDEELLIPMVDEYILSINHQNRMITMDLPEGLLDL